MTASGMLPCADGTCLSSDLFCNGVADCNSSTTIFTDELCDFDNLLCPQSQFKVNISNFSDIKLGAHKFHEFSDNPPLFDNFLNK